MKKFRYFTVLILLTCLIAAMLLFTACNDGSAKQTENNLTNTTIPNVETNELGNKTDCAVKTFRFGYIKNCPTAFKIDSTDELNEFCSEEELPFFYANERSNNIITIFNSYDDDFFQNKSLIVVFKFRANTKPIDFKDVKIDGNLCNVILTSPKDNEEIGYFASVSTFAYLIEIDKEKVADVTQINIKEIEE